MRNTKAANRYAKSLMDLAIEQGKLDQCYEDMQAIDKVVDESRELRAVLRSPVIKQDKKHDILEGLFSGKVDKLTLSFLDIIGTKGRDALLPEIIEAFIRQVKHHKHIMVAKVISATALDEATREKIKNIITQVHNGGLELLEEVDPSIIGGFILNIADKRIDASIKGQIRDLRKEFEANLYEAKL